MAKCELCGKISKTGFQVSHSHHGTKRVWKPNLRRVKALIDRSVRTINVCAKCLKAGKVQKA